VLVASGINNPAGYGLQGAAAKAEPKDPVAILVAFSRKR
jgi:hypothetical protein